MIQSAILQNNRYGVKNRCLNFNGTSDFVNCGTHVSLALTTEITIEAWVKKTNGNDRYIFTKMGLSGNRGYTLQINSSGMLRMRLYISNVSSPVNSEDGVISQNEWTHVAATVKTGEQKLYKNGVPLTLTDGGALTFTTFNSSSANAVIARGFISSDPLYFGGLIDEIRVWNHARTADQIKRYMNVRLTGKETGLVAYYPMNEGTGSTAYDKSTNSNDGTITGATWITP